MDNVFSEEKSLKEMFEEIVKLKENEFIDKESKLKEQKNEINKKIEDIKRYQIALENKEKQIEEKNTEISKTLQALNIYENEIKIRENEIEESLQEIENLRNDLKCKENKLEKEKINITEKSQELLKRENEIKKQEFKIDEEIASLNEKLNALEIEHEKKILNESQTKKTEHEEMLFEEYKKNIEKLEEERLNRLEQHKEKIDAMYKEYQKLLDDKFLLKDKELLEKEDILNKREKELKDVESSLNLMKRRLEHIESDLNEKEEEIDIIINERIEEKVKHYENIISSHKHEIERVREYAKNINDELLALNSLKNAYGEPVEVTNKINELQRRNAELEHQLANRPGADIEEKYEKVQMDFDTLKRKYLTLEDNYRELTTDKNKLDNFELEIENLKAQNKILENNKEIFENEYERVQEKLKRLTSPDGRLSDREERIEEIRSGHLKEIVVSENALEEKNEIEWLNKIEENCKTYGITFPKRILYAFHTALKISDWSSIAVLAGVSGTGKSELPRLYSAFGGLNFINVPVQPNWDSQESMLGFFNSIDNRFDAQPLLKFLVECTEQSEFSNYMSIVLLDEMNLAHVEHYFAEFLSKLETRRGTKKDSVPSIDIKLGAGVEPYKLQLSRSILWTGTMNQDETTKSLSDKVLDRGIVINFPRPKRLIGRTNMGIIEDTIISSNRAMLKKSIWSKWIVRELKFEGDQEKELTKYKGIVEDINEALEKVGRALGHRVWQSIEYYIANYPLVIDELQKSEGQLTNELKKAMDVAFEDQIVQKIMPKLRGIETRGTGKESLDNIQGILENKGFANLTDDFRTAREQGYGQFMWSSAKYIGNDIEKEYEESVKVENEEIVYNQEQILATEIDECATDIDYEAKYEIEED